MLLFIQFGLVLVGMSTIFAEQGTSAVGQTVLGKGKEDLIQLFETSLFQY